MVVTSGIERAIQYFHAFQDYLKERKSPYQAIVAFSGEHDYGGANVTEASLNGFPSSQIADKIKNDPYRFLVCADKFQTGYDEPLLHTMYVDKPLSGIKAVQTLSRLNRAHPKKYESYRVEKQAVMRIQLPDQDAEIGPVPTSSAGHKPEPELDRLSNILKTFNDQFGSIEWTDADRVKRLITEEIPAKVAADAAYQNARKNSDKQNARIEHDKALARVMTAVLKDDTQLFKQFSDNESFRKWLTDTIFEATYQQQIPNP